MLACAHCPLGPLPWRAIPALGEPAGQCRVPGDRSSPRGFRQALVDRYSKLSAEAARREQKALWKIQRHRLAGARLRFLLEDQERIQVPPWLLACGALRTPDTARRPVCRPRGPLVTQQLLGGVLAGKGLAPSDHSVERWEAQAADKA